jgi:hypothetical protein
LLLAEWFSKPEVLGEYQGLRQFSKSEFEKKSGTEDKHEMKKEDRTKIGIISHFYALYPAGC